MIDNLKAFPTMTCIHSMFPDHKAAPATDGIGREKPVIDPYDAYWRNHQANVIETYLPDDVYLRITKGQSQRGFFPKFRDREAWNALAVSAWKEKETMKIIEEANCILASPLKALSTYDYFRFTLEGDRVSYEKSYFQRRNDLGTLVLACCISGDRERYFPGIIDRLGAIISEPYWCMHAHARQDGDPLPPFDTACRIDLFAAETAQLMALTIQLLGDELMPLSPRFLRLCVKRTLEKAVEPVLEHFTDPSFGFWLRPPKGMASNWTPWCAGNILLAGALLLDDPEKLADLTRKLNDSVSRFFESVPENGFCEEGPSYWSKSMVKCFYYFHVLDAMLPGIADELYGTSKLHEMGEFGPGVIIAGEDAVLFADSGHVPDKGFADAGILYLFGRKIHSFLLQNFAFRKCLDSSGGRPTPKKDPHVRLGTGDRLSSMLCSLFHLPDIPEISGQTPLPARSFWADRLGILRNPEGFSGSLKAGNNGELHNHNDLGHFTLYYRDTPLVIDLGTGTYSRRNFSEERYTLLCTSAQGHNAPVLGRIMQRSGDRYAARLNSPCRDVLRCDLTKAYPPEAKIVRYVRSLTCDKSHCSLQDAMETTARGTWSITLFSPVKVSHRGRKINFGGIVECDVQGMAIRVGISALPVDDIPHHWGTEMNRIIIRSPSPNLELSFTPFPPSGMAQ